MPTINKRLLLKLSLLAIVLTGGVFAIHHFQADRITEALKWQSERAAKEGKTEAAIHYLRQYLEFRPDDLDAQVKLTELMHKPNADPKRLANILFLYEKILREDPSRNDVRRRTVDVCIALARFGDALTHADVLLKTDADSPKLWQQIAICRMAQNKNDDAREAFERAIACDPKLVRNYELLAELLIRKLGRHREAGELLDRMVAADPTNADARLVRARYLRSIDKIAECEAEVAQLLKLNPKSVDGALLLSELRQNRGDIQEARRLLNAALKDHPRDMRLYRHLSWLELYTGNLPAATECLEAGIKHLPNEMELLTPYADLLIQQGDVGKAQGIFNKLEKRKTASNQLRYLKARLLMHDQKWQAAVDLLEGLRTESVNLPGLVVQVNLLLAVCRRNLGDRDGEIAALERVINLDENNISARLGLGNLKLNVGRFEEGLKDFAVVAASPYAPMEARLLYGRLRFAKLLVQQGNADEWRRLEEFTRILQAKHPQAIEPILLTAEIHEQQGRREEARKVLKQEIGKRPTDGRLWVAYAEFAARIDGFLAALAVLDEAQSLLGDSVDFRIARARLRLRDNHPSREKVLRRIENDLDGFTDAEQQRLLFSLADLYVGMRDLSAAARIYQQLCARLPKDVHVRKLAADLALERNDPATFATLRREIEQLEGPNGKSADALAIAAVLAENKRRGNTERGSLEKQLRQARDLISAAPSRPEFHILLGKLAEAEGELETAVQSFDRAVELDRSNLHVLRDDLRFRFARLKETETKKLVESLLLDARLTPDRFRALLGAALADLPTQQLTKTLTWLTPLVTTSLDGSLWLANILSERGLADEATARYRAACRQMPGHPDPWVGLATHLIRINRLPQFEDAIAQAKKALPERTWLSVCAIAADELFTRSKTLWEPPASDGAKSAGLSPQTRFLWLRARLNLELSRGRREEALAFLEGFRKSGRGTPDQLAWAERTSALLRSIGGSPEERLQAVKQLKAVSEHANESPEDRQARIAILALVCRHLDGRERTALLTDTAKMLEKSADSGTATPTDLFHLYQVQKNLGDRSAYRATLAKLLAKEPKNLTFLTAQADDLLQTRELRAVEPIIAIMLENHANDYRAILVLTRYFTMTNAGAKVTELIENYIRAADPTTADALARVRQAADLYDQLSQYAAVNRSPLAETLRASAIAKYHACLRSTPEALVPLAGLLALDGKPAEAFELLHRMRATTSPRLLTGAGVAVVRTGTATPRQIEQVREWLETALKQNPDSVPLLLNLAELQSILNDLSGAEKSYRAVLKLSPDNLIALNNLAWILAPGQSAELAEELIQRAIKVNGHTGELLDTRARIRIAKGEYPKAIDDLNEAIAEQPTSLRYFHMALAKLKQSNNTEALEIFRKAKSSGLDPRMVHPNDLPTYRLLEAQAKNGA